MQVEDHCFARTGAEYSVLLIDSLSTVGAVGQLATGHILPCLCLGTVGKLLIWSWRHWFNLA